MAYTLDQLANIEAAISTGSLRVMMDGRLVIYQTLGELMVLRDRMRGELGVETPASARGRAWRPTTTTGLT